MKRPRAMRPSEILPCWFRVQKSERIVDDALVEEAQRLSDDPVEFFRQIVGFEPTAYQKEFIGLFLENQFLAARWCRQSGKSWIVSALLLWYAVTHPDSYIAVVGPSWRQAKLVIRRIARFVRNLPPGMAFKPLKAIIRFTNGSVIEAFPNNPDTIRGPTFHVVYADEWNFMPNAEEMYDAILFTLGTTNGKLVCSSTPWNKDSIFYKIFFHEGYEDFAKHHVTWQQALEPNGPLRKKILEKIRKQLAEDPWRWKREMEAEWAEDETTWLQQSLITKCIDGDLELWDFDSHQRGGKFYAGLDLGKLRDYSVLIVVEEVEGRYLLRHWKVFPLGTKYATVIGYVKTLCDRWEYFERVRVDITGVGEYVVEDMQNSGIEAEIEGVTFTLPRKQEMASLLKQRMLDGVYRFPYVDLRLSPTVSLSYVAELNVERFELRKDGTIAFNHPQGTHDDTYWATCLSLYCAVKMGPEAYVGVVLR